MSNSTPLSELHNNVDNNSTQPLVQDILKEIQQEDAHHAPNMINNVQTNADFSQPLDTPPITDTSDHTQYANQQEQALQYQLDPNINSPDMQDISQSQQLSDSQYQAIDQNNMNLNNPNMMLQNSDFEATSVPKTMAQKIFIQAREPLLVMLISILLSVPIINHYLSLFISKISGNSYTVAIHIGIKALCAALLFYTIRKLF